MKRRIFSLFIIVITMIVLSGCFATDTTTIEFVEFPDAIYTFNADPTLNKIDLTKVKIRINDGNPINLEEAKALGVVITGDTFDSAGNHTLKIKYQSATITYVYRVEGQGDEADIAVYEQGSSVATLMSFDDFRDSVNGVGGPRKTYLGATVYLLRDIVVGNLETEWTPIGDGINEAVDDRKPFMGTFDGNNFTITVNIFGEGTTRRDYALFGHIKDGKVKNLKLAGEVEGPVAENPVKGNINVGVLASWVTGSSVIENIYNQATVDARTGKQAAGIVIALGDGQTGLVNVPTIKNCVNDAEVTGGIKDNSQTAGIVAVTKGDFKIENCVNYGDIISNSPGAWTGGIVGVLQNDNQFGNLTVRLSECINYGTVYGTEGATSSECIGGIVGKIGTGNTTISQIGSKVYINNLYNLAEIVKTYKDSLVGGIFGAGSSAFFNSGAQLEGSGEILALSGQAFISNSTPERLLGSTPVEETFIDANDQTYLVTVYRKN